MMRKFVVFMFLETVIISSAYSNNIQITNVTLTGQNTLLHYSFIRFNISWENSWRTSTLESNWDAAWVFVKYRKKHALLWNHVTLSGAGHFAPAGSIIETPLDRVGVFIRKNSDGIGNVSWTNVLLKWDYGINGVNDNDSLEVCVYGIEMVYIPTCSFFIGDGSSGFIEGHFEAGNSGTPYQITSEAPITLGGVAITNLNSHNSVNMSTVDDFNYATIQILPANFPKGYNAFYIMKYEISQEQYVQFLNKLTYDQQVWRTSVQPNSAIGSYALSNTFRNGIRIITPGNFITPAIYGCDLNGNNVFSESNDGQNVACNYLNWNDLVAYLDWSGLRPLTELEFEKACRGGNVPVSDEYAWGNTSITGATGISNNGAANEKASNAGANCVYNDAVGVQGPMRVGCFAQFTNRRNSGGSYFGVMELSGNLWERTVSVGNVNGRNFTGLCGDGNLDESGFADVPDWPTFGDGGGFRGNEWYGDYSNLRVSDRRHASRPAAGRLGSYGGRGARNIP